MRNNTTRYVALTGMLFGLALVLGMFESMLAPVMGLPPGIKLGLANVVVMYTLLFLTKSQALVLVVLKATFAFLTRGGMAGVLSLTGGLVSMGVMLLLMIPRQKPSVAILSVTGALAHNVGQFIMVRLLLGAAYTYLLPILLIAGVVMGILTSLVLRAVLPALQKAGLVKKINTQTKKQMKKGDNNEGISA